MLQAWARLPGGPGGTGTTSNGGPSVMLATAAAVWPSSSGMSSSTCRRSAG